jgi:hypothetical protein
MHQNWAFCAWRIGHRHRRWWRQSRRYRDPRVSSAVTRRGRPRQHRRRQPPLRPRPAAHAKAASGCMNATLPRPCHPASTPRRIGRSARARRVVSAGFATLVIGNLFRHPCSKWDGCAATQGGGRHVAMPGAGVGRRSAVSQHVTLLVAAALLPTDRMSIALIGTSRTASRSRSAYPTASPSVIVSRDSTT